MINFESADALVDDQFLLVTDDTLKRNGFESDGGGEEERKPKKKRISKSSKNEQLGREDGNKNQEKFKKDSKLRSPARKSLNHENSKKKLQEKDSNKTQKSKQKEGSLKKAFVKFELSPASESPNELNSIGIQPPDLQLDYLIDRQKRGLPGISDLELESLRIELDWIQDVSNKLLRAQLGSWLKTSAIPELLSAIAENSDLNGAPVALVVTSSALRAVDLCREVKPLISSPKDSGEVTKLFARHFKLKEQIDHLNSVKSCIGVGTPDRLSKLMASGALKLDRLKWIILDVTWTDSKDYTLTELPDNIVRSALWNGILGFEKVIKNFKSGKTKLVIF